MRIVVNGEPREVAPGTGVPDLLLELGLSDRPCAVEVNERVVPKGKHASCALKDGDRIELVTLVGGG